MSVCVSPESQPWKPFAVYLGTRPTATSSLYRAAPHEVKPNPPPKPDKCYDGPHGTHGQARSIGWFRVGCRRRYGARQRSGVPATWHRRSTRQVNPGEMASRSPRHECGHPRAATDKGKRPVAASASRERSQGAAGGGGQDRWWRLEHSSCRLGLPVSHCNLGQLLRAFKTPSGFHLWAAS